MHQRRVALLCLVAWRRLLTFAAFAVLFVILSTVAATAHGADSASLTASVSLSVTIPELYWCDDTLFADVPDALSVPCDSNTDTTFYLVRTFVDDTWIYSITPSP